MLFSIIFVLALGVSEAVASTTLTLRSTSTNCYADDKLRALRRCSNFAATYCKSISTASPTPTSCVSRFQPSDVASACSCFLKEQVSATASTASSGAACTPTQPIKDPSFENRHTETPETEGYINDPPYWYRELPLLNGPGAAFFVDTTSSGGYNGTISYVSFIRSDGIYQDLTICKHDAVQKYKLTFYVQLMPEQWFDADLSAFITQGSSQTDIPLTPSSFPSGERDQTPWMPVTGVLQLTGSDRGNVKARFTIYALLKANDGINVDQVTLDPT